MVIDASDHAQGTVLVHDLTSGTDRSYFTGAGRICSIALSGDGSRVAAQFGDPRFRNYFSFDGGDWGESVEVSETTANATPEVLALRTYNPTYASTPTASAGP